MDKAEETYEIQRTSLTDVKRVAQAAWEELQNPNSQVFADAKDAGIDSRELQGQFEDHIRISRSGMPVSPGDYYIAVTMLSVVAVALWNKALLPYILHNLGVDALRGKSKAITKHAQEQTLKVLRKASKAQAQQRSRPTKRAGSRKKKAAKKIPSAKKKAPKKAAGKKKA